MPVSIELQDEIDRLLRHIDRDLKPAAKKAIVPTLNRVGRKAFTVSKRTLSKQMGIAQKGFKREVFLIKANRDRLHVTLVGRGKPIELIHFKGTRQTAVGIASSAWGKRKVYKGGFIATVGTGHRGTFKRKGDARLPIKTLWGPSVPTTMEDETFQDAIDKVVEENFEQEFDRNYRRFTERAQR